MLYIIRHGQTSQNKKGLLQGRSDHPLNDEGEKQAKEAGARFKEQGIIFDAVYSSPLKRAVMTADLAAPGVPVYTDDRLLEMDYGPYEGADLKDPPKELLDFFHDFANCPAPPGMEPLASVTERLGSFLEEIAGFAESSNILISTHAIAMKGALEYLTPGSNGSYWSKYIGNCEVYFSSVKDGKYSVPAGLKRE